MLLVIDVGNSHTVLGLYHGQELRGHWRVATRPERTSDEWAVDVLGLLGMDGIEPKGIKNAVISSVVPPLTGLLVEMTHRCFGIEPLLVGPGVKTGIKILYDNPLEVGADRIVNSVAAFELVGGPVIVVDFGTATTFDAISANAEYLGGIIIPGIQISADSLSARAAKLPRVELRKPPQLIGRNTIHSIQSGLYHGYSAMIKGVLGILKEEMEGEPQVIVTGGLGTQLANDLEEVDRIEPDLTLEGLRLIHQKNHTA